MAVVYSNDLKDDRLQVIADALDGGDLQIGTTGMGSVLATIPLDSPAGTVSAQVLTFDMPQSDTSADNTGTAAEAWLRDSGGTPKVTGLTVGLSAANIVLDSLSITAGQTVTINTATITHG